MGYLNPQMTEKLVEKLTYEFLLHSNEKERRKSGHIGMEPVISCV